MRFVHLNEAANRFFLSCVAFFKSRLVWMTVQYVYLLTHLPNFEVDVKRWWKRLIEMILHAKQVWLLLLFNYLVSRLPVSWIELMTMPMMKTKVNVKLMMNYEHRIGKIIFSCVTCTHRPSVSHLSYVWYANWTIINFLPFLANCLRQ